MNIDKWLPLVITYVPSIVFIFIIALYTFLGYARGLRKSVIFLVYSLISLLIMIILFCVLTNTDVFNYKFVEVTNNIMGDFWLQDTFGVNSQRDNLTDILTEVVLKNSEQSILDIALYSHAYIVALVQALLRLIIAICLLVLFFLLKIFNYILYLIFNKQSRRIKKINALYRDGLEPYPYQFHRGYGLVLGLVRGLVSALVIFAFIGSPLYLVYYNQSYLDKVNVESDDEASQTSQYVLKELSKYGNSGIYKILNTVKNENDVPYYLFITDVVMQGKIEDERLDYSKNVYFYTELIKYRKFIDDSFDLILYYDTDSLIINDINKGTPDKIYDDLLKIFSNNEFQQEFKILFESFDKNTYLIDLSYSVLDGIVNNIDSLSFASDEVADLLKIMFKKGYKSEYIAYEKSLSSSTVLPYISVRNLIPYNDIDKVLSLYFAYVKAFTENDKDDKYYILNIVSNMSTDLKYFSVLNSTDSNINGVFRRVYAFVSNVYLNTQDDEKIETCIFDSKYDNVCWSEETKALCDSIPSLLNIYKAKLIDLDINSCNFIDLIYKFNEQDVSEDYQNVREALMTSNVLEVVINSGLMSTVLKETLNNTFKDFAYPKIVDSKETFIIIDSIISNQDKKDSLNYIIKNKLEESNYDTYIASYNNVFDSQMRETCANSNLFRSILTSVLVENASDYIYIDSSVLEVESSEVVNRITLEECTNFLNISNRLFELSEPFIIGSDDYSMIDESIQNGELLNLLSQSKLAEGSISKMLFESNEFELLTPDDMLYVSNNTNKSEILRVIQGVQILDLSIKELKTANFDNVYDCVKSKSQSKLSIVFDSDVIYLNVAKYIFDNKTTILKDVIVPNTCLDTKYTNYIKKDVIIGLVTDVVNIYDDTLSTNELINKFSRNKNIFKESLAKDILNATVAYKIVGNASEYNIDLTDKMQNDGQSASLENYYSTNVWYDEVYYILEGLDQFRDSSDNVNIDSIVNNMIENFSSLNNESSISGKTILNILYESNLLKYNITTQALDKLSSSIDSDVLNSNFIASYDSYINGKVILEEELSKSIEVLDILNLDINSNLVLNVNVLNEDYTKGSITKKKSEFVSESKIARAIASKSIKEELDKNFISTPDKALEYCDNKYINVYLENEVKTLSKFINDYDISNINNIKIKDLINLLYDGNELQSYVVLNEISENIKTIENVVIPIEDYSKEDNMIREEAVYNILNAFLEFNIEYVEDNMLDSVVLQSENLEYAYESKTILATISKTLKINFSNARQEICVFSENAICTLDYQNKDIYMMSAMELKACVTELNKLGVSSIYSNISSNDIINYLMRDDIDLESSDIIHILISNLFANNKNIYAYVSTTYTTIIKESCINLNTYKSVSKNVYYKS